MMGSFSPGFVPLGRHTFSVRQSSLPMLPVSLVCGHAAP